MSRRANRRREEEDSFREAFLELYPKAYRLGWRLLGERTAAEDVASEAMARAFARWPRVRGLPHRDAWVLRVAANIAIDVVRRRPPLPERPVAVDVEDALATRVALAAALRALPERQRDAVVLRYLNDYSEAQVAEALGVSPGTVKTHLRRGLRALRSKVGDEFGRNTIVA
jgi:RNA polymerase sigma-70 factor (sigma-E family)